MTRADERFLVVTEHGRVLVVVRGDKRALDADLLDVRRGDDPEAAGVAIETPLRAFAAKMIDLLVARGTDALPLSPAMRGLMVKEKAAEDLRRIERSARALAADAPPPGTA
ncbi:MAG: hypothetical protein P1P87_11485 [Trueperaceae bacterium]|nr:hypothetical protein [Trueperaceae bacterium]